MDIKNYFVFMKVKADHGKDLLIPKVWYPYIIRKRVGAIRSRLCRLLKKHYLVKDIYFSITQEKDPFLLTCFYIFDDDLSRFVHILSLRQEPRTFHVGWLVVLRLNVPVNNFSVMSGRSHRFLGN